MGLRSEMGLPVQMLPATEAAFRIWTPAKYLSCSRMARKAQVWCSGRAFTRECIASIMAVSVTEPPTSKEVFDTCTIAIF